MKEKELLKRIAVKSLEQYAEKVSRGYININYPADLEKEIIGFLKKRKNRNEFILCQYYCFVLDGKIESFENHAFIFNVMHDLASKNYVLAQERLGFMYQFFNNYTDDDYKEALYWYLKAAEQGYDEAEFQVGCFYEIGKGTKQNFKKAVYWYKKAAEQNHPNAQYCLGECFCYGRGVKQDYNEAKYWFTKALENGYENAQKVLDSLSK